jgi:hypothetical protein
MTYNFAPINFIEDINGVVKLVDIGTHYSTYIEPFDFEVDDSNDMFICGQNYEVNEATASLLFNSGYGAFLTPEFVQDIEE